MPTPPDEPLPPNPGPERPVWKDGLLGCVVVAVLAAVAVPGVRTRPEVPIDVPSVARLAKLVELARDEAIESGDDHFLYFEAARQAGDEAEGAHVLLFRDIDGNAEPSEIEMMGRYPIAPAHWGRAMAGERAIGDAGLGLRGPWAFDPPSVPAAIDDATLSEADRASRPSVTGPVGVRGVVFDSAGVPHRVEESGLRAEPGSGAGSLYLRTAKREYAVVLSPWGDVDVQRWDAKTHRWLTAIAP